MTKTSENITALLGTVGHRLRTRRVCVCLCVCVCVYVCVCVCLCIDIIYKAQNRAMINIRPNNNKTISPSNSPRVTLCLPYRNITFSDKIMPIFYTGQSIGSTLIHTNLHKLSDLSLGSICKVCYSKIFECSIPNVIYQLTCKLCTHNNSKYISETSKTAYKRLVEHWLAIHVVKMLIYLVLQSILIYITSHTLSKHKPPLSLTIIDRANSYTERKIKEAAWICKLKPSLSKKN